MSLEFLIQQMKSPVAFGSLVSFSKCHLPWEENLVAIFLPTQNKMLLK